MNIEKCVSEYAKKNGLGDGVAFEEGVCHLEIAGRDIGFMEIPEIERLLVWTAIMECPEERGGQFCRLLLRANFMEQGLKGGAFSLSEDNIVYAHRTFASCDMEGDRFAAEMDQFVREVGDWCAGIANFQFTNDILEGVAKELGPIQDEGDWVKV